ncbi:MULTISPECIES: type I-E CRISPR-associated protein Cse1/CasA [Enterobacterales]|uniref:type I-E CRISPR-associated protein Cse1/CasA n=1 Tax=Enterobacterales TaxID=91347 RepID=UPI002EDA2AC4
MDLITERWLPVTLTSGEQIKISLSELLADNIVDAAYPRADFQGAAWQMLIGIMQCTVAPEDRGEWKSVWKKGIDESQWKKALGVISSALQFGEQKPSFLQSFDALDCEAGPVSGLLIDAPGGNALKLNKDHFVKRGNTDRICPHCAVMALFTVQTNSPAGGAGFRVGMRGGGPLTTLVVPQDEASVPLWKKLWLNVLVQETALTTAQLPLIFPWLAATRTSEKPGNSVTPDNAHPLQAYWGMPRRIELDFSSTEPGRCSLCGETHDNLLIQMRGKNYGVQYDSWRHPFSPYRAALKDPSAPWLALKGQPGGLSYKDWMGLLWDSEDNYNKTQPAKVVRAASRVSDTHLWCFAYDMDNAKARCWYQHRIPMINTSVPELFNGVMTSVISTASDALFVLKKALKSAMFDAPSEAKVDFSMREIAFWQETEPAFRRLVAALTADPHCAEQKTRKALRLWDSELHHYVITAFDRQILTNADCPDKILMRQLDARRVLESDYSKLKARKELLMSAEEDKETRHD